MGGFFQQSLMACFVFNTHSFVRLAVRVFHELIHFKSYHAVRFVGILDGVINVLAYRNGIITESARKKDVVYFLGMDEAINTELTIRFYKNILSKNEIFREETQKTESIISDLKSSGVNSIKIADELFPLEDVYYLNLVEGKLDAEIFGYSKERAVLNRVLDFIFLKNPDIFFSKEDVFNIFAKGMFDGNILPAARLVEKTFGKGAFRALGEEQNITI